MKADGRARVRRLPLVGHAPAFLRDRLGFLSAAAAGADRAVELRIGARTFLLVDAEEVRHVLVANAANYDKSPRLVSERGRDVSGRGLVTLSGPAHRRQRLMLQPGFHFRAVAAYADGILAAVEHQVARWRDGASIDVADEMNAITSRASVSAMLGDLSEDEHEQLGAAIRVRRRYIEHVFASVLPYPERLPWEINREHARARATMHSAIERRLARVRADPDGSLLSMLAHARSRDDGGLTDEEVRDEATIQLVTGHETLGVGLAWTWYLLGQHADVEARLHQELESALRGRSPAAGVVSALPYTGMVLSESLRLFPPTWLFVRMAKAPDVLPTGVAIPAGAKIYVSQFVLHRRERYFPEPERFDPERFAPGAARALPRHAYIPFGSGPRVCIGEALARMELGLVLAAIAPRFRLSPLPTTTAVPEPSITLKPRGPLMLTVRRR